MALALVTTACDPQIGQRNRAPSFWPGAGPGGGESGFVESLFMGADRYLVGSRQCRKLDDFHQLIMAGELAGTTGQTKYFHAADVTAIALAQLIGLRRLRNIIRFHACLLSLRSPESNRSGDHHDILVF